MSSSEQQHSFEEFPAYKFRAKPEGGVESKVFQSIEEFDEYAEEYPDYKWFNNPSLEVEIKKATASDIQQKMIDKIAVLESENSGLKVMIAGQKDQVKMLESQVKDLEEDLKDAEDRLRSAQQEVVKLTAAKLAAEQSGVKPELKPEPKPTPTPSPAPVKK